MIIRAHHAQNCAKAVFRSLGGVKTDAKSVLASVLDLPDTGVFDNADREFTILRQVSHSGSGNCWVPINIKSNVRG